MKRYVGGLAAVGASAVLLSVGIGPAFAGDPPARTFYVNNNGTANPDRARGSCNKPHFNEVWEAVEAANELEAGSRIFVCPSNQDYEYGGVATQQMSIRGLGEDGDRPTVIPGLGILGPGDPTTDHVFRIQGPALPPSPNEGAEDSRRVKIRNLRIEGPFANCGNSSGIHVTDEGHGRIINVEIFRMFNNENCQAGETENSVGIRIDEDGFARVRGSDIYRYGFAGILVEGGEEVNGLCEACVSPHRNSAAKRKSRGRAEGIEVGADAEISNNNIRGLGEENKSFFQVGILVRGEDARAEIAGNEITDNVDAPFFTNGFGILVEGPTASAFIYQNDLTDNDVNVGVIGFSLAASEQEGEGDQTSIEDNKIRDANLHGIWILSSDGVRVADNGQGGSSNNPETISGNNVDGLRIEDSTNTTVTDNEFGSNGEHDIHEIFSPDTFYDDNECNDSLPDDEDICDD